jgi:hypothetical protein
MICIHTYPIISCSIMRKIISCYIMRKIISCNTRAAASGSRRRDMIKEMRWMIHVNFVRNSYEPAAMALNWCYRLLVVALDMAPDCPSTCARKHNGRWRRRGGSGRWLGGGLYISTLSTSISIDLSVYLKHRCGRWRRRGRRREPTP